MYTLLKKKQPTMFFTNDFSRVELVRKRTHMKMFASFVRCPFTTLTKIMKADISRSKSHKTYMTWRFFQYAITKTFSYKKHFCQKSSSLQILSPWTLSPASLQADISPRVRKRRRRLGSGRVLKKFRVPKSTSSKNIIGRFSLIGMTKKTTLNQKPCACPLYGPNSGVTVHSVLAILHLRRRFVSDRPARLTRVLSTIHSRHQADNVQARTADPRL